MSNVLPVPLTTPDGVERFVRYNCGALKRIQDRFGVDDWRLAWRQNEGAIAEIGYLCMYDEKGKPPKDLDLEWYYANTHPGIDGPEIAAVITESLTRGAIKKKEAEEAYRKPVEKMEKMLEKLVTGLLSGHLPESASDSPEENSGTSIPANGMSSVGDGNSNKESFDTAPA